MGDAEPPELVGNNFPLSTSSAMHAHSAIHAHVSHNSATNVYTTVSFILHLNSNHCLTTSVAEVTFSAFVA